jgi:GNAT superfamily N-acetyltransferase
MHPRADSLPVAARTRCSVRREGASAAVQAVAILLEATAWGAAQGFDVWSPADLRLDPFAAAARAGELVIGYAGSTPAATMLLQPADPVYWPEAEPGTALYIHKLAVRRAFAGQGWLTRLFEFAATEARARGIHCLRLDTVLGPKLQSIYEAHGFSLLVEKPKLVNGRQMIRMERRLQP